MPAKPQVDGHTLVDAFCCANIFTETGALKPRSDKVWMDISNQLKGAISAKTLNFYARINRNNMITVVKERCGIQQLDTSANLTLNSTFPDDDPEFQITEASKNGPLPILYFNLELDLELWRSIAPKKDQKTEKLQPNWTDTMAKLIYKKVPLPCAFNFRKAKLSDKVDNIWLRIEGYCNDCSSILKGHCLVKPDEQCGIMISVSVPDTRGIPHNKKRRCTGSRRLEIGNELILKKAALWRKEATDNMNDDDPEPSYIPNLPTLRKLREEATNRHLGITKDRDPVSSLYLKKYEGELAGCILDIGLDEFFCIYCTGTQVKTYASRIKTIRKISIDATGSVVLPIQKPNGDSSYVFLYQIVMEGDDSIFPVFQMLSAKHDTASIQFWLSRFISKSGHFPLEVVSDFSLALLNGISLSFNECRIATYIKKCFHSLLMEERTDLPPCYIRLDIAHLIKMICRKNVFKSKLPNLKDFYTRCIGLATTCETKDSFAELIKSVLIVALSQSSGEDEKGDILSSYRNEKYLLARIATFTAPDHKETIEDNCIPEDQEEIDEDVTDFISNIKIAAEEEALNCNSVNCRPNPYFLPELMPPLIKLCKYFVLWTNVMKEKFCSKYDVGSSALVEAYFKDLKNTDMSIFHRPVRADKFVVQHIRCIEAVCKLERAAMKRKTVKTPSFIKENAPKKMCSKETKGFLEEILEESEVEYLLQEENWKVKNKTIKPTEGNDAEDNDTDDENKEMDLSEQPKEKPRGKYLKKCPNVELLYNRPHRRKQDEILHNGGSMGPVWIGKQLLQFKNTCPFDSLVEILSTAYIDNFYYKSLLDDFYTDNLTIELVKKYAVEGVSSSLYCDRGLVLKSFFDEKHQIIKCDANIGSFIEKALNGVPSASSHRTHIKNNHDCRNQKYIHHRLEVIDVEKVGHLDVQEVVIPFIDEFFARTDGECKICGGQQILERQPGPHVILDIEFAMDAFHQIHHNGLPGTTTLLQVPEEILIQEKKYILSGAIEYVPAMGGEIGHYIAYCRRVIGSWEVHNDMCRQWKKFSALNTKMTLHILIYTRKN
uniref:120.7 kDa protein in NOF-FB transposable element n=1 Tax=Drosophila melanogaster TaxID=7227 RepID=NOF_DROME|nr:RecName: Full=120.7 kDa protein in NOF-FB transposable element [Drosophila melanogaster]